MARTVSPYNPVVPSRDESAAARAALDRLPVGHAFGLIDPETGETTRLPEAAIALIHRLLEDLASGRAVSLIPLDAELSTFQAADILNVSRPYVIKLLDAGTIPHHMIGTHRRIRLDDLLAYKQQRDATSDRAMNDLAAQAQDLKMGY